MTANGDTMNSTFLLVTGDPVFQQNLSRNLQNLEASVLTASCKLEALEACSNNEIDLALLDIRQNGNETMQVLARLQKKQPGTEVILISDCEHIGLSMEGLRQGVNDDITAPFDIGQLRKKITTAMKRRTVRLKALENKTLLDTFHDSMVAATFAQAGEFETAVSVLEKNVHETPADP